MILSLITDSDRYACISEGLATAFEWLRSFKPEDFVKGKTVIGTCGDSEIYVNGEEPALLPREKASLESHRRYIDIHVPLKGTEIIGWAPVESLKHKREEYDVDRDVAFYGDAAHSLLHVKVGQMAIFFPEDAHAPNIGLGNHRKLCIKIPLQ